MADESAAITRRRKRLRRRRRTIVTGLVVILVLAGAGTAWAMRGSDGPAYRLATVGHANVSQSVDSDGALAARKTAVLAFASAGTVDTVDVAVGDTVRAGESVATIDDSNLRAAVTSAQATRAKAEQKLADDEAAQAAGTTVSSTTSGTGTSNGTGTSSAGYVRLTSAPAAPTSTSSSDVTKAQRAVVSAQRALDAAVATQDSAVRALVKQCAAGDNPTPATARATAGSGGTLSGAAGPQAVVVTLRDANGDVATTTSANPQRVPAGGTYAFNGLTAGNSYTVALVRSAGLNTAECTDAVTTVSTGQRAVDAALAKLDRALAALTRAVAGTGSGSSTGGSNTSTTTPSGGTGSSTRSTTTSGSGTSGSGTRSTTTSGTSGSGTSGSTTSGSGTSGSGTTGSGGSGNSAGVTVTAELIAADTKSIDAANAALALAQANRANATLAAPIAGKVAAVALAKGDTVSARSTSSTITVVGTGALSVDLNIGLSDIDLVKVGQTARVTVDGHSDALPAKVTYVGLTNSASSTGSSSTYPVTVQLARTSDSLYDGMGASVAIEVGTAPGVVAVPISAVHTTGTQHAVDVYSGGKATTTLVTLGVVGQDLVQIKSGLRAGQRVVLADLSAAIPTSTTNFGRNRSGSGSLTGLTGGTGTGGGPAFGGGGPPGGR